MTPHLRKLGLLWFFGTAAPSVVSASGFDSSLDALFGAREIRQVAISPDGRRVAWVQQPVNRGGRPAGFEIYGQPLDPNSAPVRITAGNQTETSIAWAPDSRSMAFLSAQAGSHNFMLGRFQAGGIRNLQA